MTFELEMSGNGFSSFDIFTPEIGIAFINPWWSKIIYRCCTVYPPRRARGRKN